MNDTPSQSTVAGSGLVERLRGEWATLTHDEVTDTWRLRREAADVIKGLREDNEKLRIALKLIANAHPEAPSIAREALA